ncbi:MAG: sigma-54 dependent transcriptional regulator [Acidobacteriota bacterium]|jgi:transcriptional regulator with GAF, ATPase, and Fis domain
MVDDDRQREIEARAAWQGVSAAFAALGRTFICVDREFRVIHASLAIDEILGAGASERVPGRRVSELLGLDLFGPAGTLTLALRAGERREGWRAHLRLDDSEHYLVSLSTATFPGHMAAACDPRVAYVIVLRPAEEDSSSEATGPTSISALIARSPAMLRIFALIENLKHSEATILITGESGTGKELVARSIHEHSPRGRGPFVAVNAGALPGELLESELFGHVRGAFTGAVRDRRGRFEMADEGTLFLDEVGDLPVPLQVKLLRVLQDGAFERLGESVTRTSRARVIAATNVDLPGAIREGRFRDDLYYRLRVVPIEVPPLRARREDIEPLARAILGRVGARQGRALQFSPDALRALLRHDWPGNVRELENALEYAVAVCRGQTLLPEDLPELGSSAPAPPTPTTGSTHPAAPPPPPATPVQTVRLPRATPEEIEHLRQVLESHRWNRGAAAKALGISRSTLWRRLREAGL